MLCPCGDRKGIVSVPEEGSRKEEKVTDPKQIQNTEWQTTLIPGLNNNFLRLHVMMHMVGARIPRLLVTSLLCLCWALSVLQPSQTGVESSWFSWADTVLVVPGAFELEGILPHSSTDCCHQEGSLEHPLLCVNCLAGSQGPLRQSGIPTVVTTLPQAWPSVESQS